MSIRLMSFVWDMDLPPGEKLVLLALADQANDAGTQCWPSVATIGRRSGQGERTVRRALHDLETKGHLTRQHRDGASTQYIIHPCQIGTPAKTAPLPKTDETPAKLAPKTSRTIKPKITQARETKIPSGFEPVVKPESITGKVMANWPPGRLADELEHFADHHVSKGTTSFDWQASWRTWVKNSKKWEPRDGRQQSNRPGPLGPSLSAAERFASFGDVPAH